MTHLRGKFLLAGACNSSTSRRFSELIFSLFSSDFFFMIQRVICIIQETKKIFFLMTLLDWLISCIRNLFNLIYNETDFAKFLDYRQHLVVMSIVVRCEASIIGDSLARGHWDPSVHNPCVCRTFSVITWDNPFPDFFCFLGVIDGAITYLYLYPLLLNIRLCEWCLCLCALYLSMSFSV